MTFYFRHFVFTNLVLQQSYGTHASKVDVRVSYQFQSKASNGHNVVVEVFLSEPSIFFRKVNWVHEALNVYNCYLQQVAYISQNINT